MLVAGIIITIVLLMKISPVMIKDFMIGYGQMARTVTKSLVSWLVNIMLTLLLRAV